MGEGKAAGKEASERGVLGRTRAPTQRWDWDQEKGREETVGSQGTGSTKQVNVDFDVYLPMHVEIIV